MSRQLKVTLSDNKQQELEAARDHHALPYLRERAAAILKIAAGASGRHVALYGLLKPRKTDTVYGWLHRYLAEGLAGLVVKKGRGRKPAFSPSASRR